MGHNISVSDLFVNKKALSVFLWEVEFSSQLSKTYLGIFDLNAWYLVRQLLLVLSTCLNRDAAFTDLGFLASCKDSSITKPSVFVT